MVRGIRLAVSASAAAAAAVLIAVPVAAMALTGSSGPGSPRPVNSPPSGRTWSPAAKSGPRSMAKAGRYTAYVAVVGSYSVAKVDVATHTILADDIGTDTGEGVAVTPDGKTIYVADTGQYQVLAVDAATKKQTRIFVGAYPSDVAVSPDGSQVYATVRGGDTGPGGSQTVAVISTADNRVTAQINVGAAPRQVLFAPDGRHAYVSTAKGVVVIDTATRKVSGRVAGIPTAQSLALAEGRLYITQPDANRVWVVDVGSVRTLGSFSAGQEPWAVAVTPDGKKVFVADMNSDSVGVYDAASHKRLADVGVGRLPCSIAVTPDGSEVWVGNDMTGTISVINTATDRLTFTISGGKPNQVLDSAPLDIAFGKNF